MRNWDPRAILGLGFFLVLVGFVAPLLMVLHIVQPTYWLSFLSYAASFGGLMLGLIGAAWYAARMRRR